ncbi:MAG TPA: WbqC family protein, partial [Ignavibacteria bacterium]|nr:WbqC family protein [Ignavibacteria bacterium]
MKIAAIHQPSFFPWLGFFNKIVRSDVFVILDNVQFPKTGGYWANRVKLVVGGKGEWVTMPINRSYSGTKNINEIEIDKSRSWNQKMLKS